MAITLMEAAFNLFPEDDSHRLSDLFNEPPASKVTFYDEWDYAEFEGVRISRRQEWKFEDGRFIGSYEEYVSDYDKDAARDLETLVEKWRGEGKDEIVAYFMDEDNEDGFDWSDLRWSATMPHEINAPITEVTFFKRRPISSVSWRPLRGVFGEGA